MVKYVSQELDKCIKRTTREVRPTSKERIQPIVAIALDEYLDLWFRNKTRRAVVDSTFKVAATCQIRTFLFAGHDTSSSTLCYCYHLLSIHPQIRDKLIKEHNQILGQDPTQSPLRVSEKPHLLNKLPYTSAVIKETLRLYPPASSTRNGEPGTTVVVPDGRHYPTEGMMVWSNHVAIHRDPSVWKQPEKFVPERWLVGQDDPLYPAHQGAWRPFEHGPRSCMGQELALIEIKLILVLTMREFRIESAYEELDMSNPPKGLKTLNGDRAYQIQLGAAHPPDGFPCAVFLTSDSINATKKNEEDGALRNRDKCMS